jgi:TPR repeat protein
LSAEREIQTKNALGISYEHGDGIVEDNLAAFNWFYKAAIKGYLAAQHNLAADYRSRGTPKVRLIHCTQDALPVFLIDRMWDFCGTHIATTWVIVSKTNKCKNVHPCGQIMFKLLKMLVFRKEMGVEQRVIRNQ